MKKQLLLTKVLLIAICLIGGVSSAWAYEVPVGMEVKEILIGTANGTNVDAYTFSEDGATVPSFTNSSKFAITTDLPTDVWNSLSLHMSGSALRLGSKTTHEIDFTNAVTSGQVVFSTDFYVGTHQKQIKFIDKDNNVVAYFAYSDKSASNGRVYGQQYLFAGADYADGATFSSTPGLNDTYQGTRNREYQITEFVIDLDNNKITYSGKAMDRRSSSNNVFSDNATITFSDDVTIKGVIIDATACGSETYYGYFDNMKLFSVGAAAGSHNYSIKAVAGGSNIKLLAGGTVAEGEVYSVYVPKTIISDSKYYVLDDAGNTNLNSFYASYTMGTSGDELKEINYTLNPNIVYYGDWETAYSTTSSNYGIESEKSSLSQGQGRTIKKTDVTMSLTFTAPVTGKYQIEIPYLNPNNKDRTHIIYLDGTEEANKLEEKSVAKDGGYGKYNNEVALTAGSHTIYVKCTYNLTAAMDYLMVTLKEATSTIGANGYTTFASPYALDLTDANRPEGLKAYKASLSGTTLSFTALNQKVPAGTGLLLLGETKGGSYDITVVASGDAVDGNDLTGVTADTPMQSNTEGDYIFIMRKASSADSPLTFAPLSTTTEVTVPAGKAYITVPASAFATLSRDLSISFGDETTSIADVRSKMEDVRGDYYNLQGQRVKAPTKGLYIVNGKKVIMK